jgi:hypothetical protein
LRLYEEALADTGIAAACIQALFDHEVSEEGDADRAHVGARIIAGKCLS